MPLAWTADNPIIIGWYKTQAVLHISQYSAAAAGMTEHIGHFEISLLPWLAVITTRSQMDWLRTTHFSVLSSRILLTGLVHGMLGKNFSRWHSEIFFCTFLKTQALAFHGTICMKWPSYFFFFFLKKKKNIINLLSNEFAYKVVKVNKMYKGCSWKQRTHEKMKISLSFIGTLHMTAV